MFTGPSRLARSLTSAVVALALIATACGGSSGDVAVESSAPAADTAPVTTESQPEPAEAALVASTVAGGQIDFGALEGQDVVLWFWAPW